MSQIKPDSNAKLAEKIAKDAGVVPSECYQCGKCSAGCPMAHAMDLQPREVVRCLQLGDADKLLNSKTIWLCAACHVCVDRCPNTIDIPSLNEHARFEAKKKKICAVKEVDRFNDIFIQNIKLFGKSQEAILEGAYNVVTGHLMQDMGSVPHMLRAGLIRPEVIHTVKDRDGVNRLIRAAEKEDAEC
ncbi:MAG: 4Fe-4S dicluster domain-containing protein [Oscillospiraceae bacterium]|nr:4Fe-4S dicluster domain-containing protein [Oscillospiraceae bacterium]